MMLMLFDTAPDGLFIPFTAVADQAAGADSSQSHCSESCENGSHQS